MSHSEHKWENVPQFERKQCVPAKSNDRAGHVPYRAYALYLTPEKKVISCDVFNIFLE